MEFRQTHVIKRMSVRFFHSSSSLGALPLVAINLHFSIVMSCVKDKSVIFEGIINDKAYEGL